MLYVVCSAEYCASRADPSVRESQYLRHIGENLNPAIDIMWTGWWRRGEKEGGRALLCKQGCIPDKG